MSNNNFLGNLLRHFREFNNLTLHELSLLIDIDSTLISKFENGSRVPTMEQIQKYAFGFNIRIENLVALLKAQAIIRKYGLNITTLQAANILLSINEEKDSFDVNKYIQKK